MLIENPQPNASGYKDAPYRAVRKRKPDGTQNVGGQWLEPFGSIYEHLEDQVTWEVVFYGRGDKLPA